MIHQIKITLTTLTPLHIGTGRTLTRDFDFRSYGGITYRLSDEGMIDALYARDPHVAEQLMRTPPGQLLKQEDLDPKSPFVRYAIQGQPQGREFREQIKDVHDRPYLPGSSLKGALRTVLAWHGWTEEGLSLASVRLGYKVKNAAQDTEGKIFGSDPKNRRHSPHHDFLRALRISDSYPASTDKLAIEQVQVMARGKGGAPISVEAVKERTKFRLRGSIDGSLFSDWSRKQPGFPLAHEDWLHAIPAIARARAAERIKRELSWWHDRGQPEKLREIESALRSAPDDSFPLQLGFGTGWEGTTIGAPLKRDDLWPEKYRDLKLGYIPRSSKKVRVENFPSSRRMVVRGHQIMPLGWVWVTWKEEG